MKERGLTSVPSRQSYVLIVTDERGDVVRRVKGKRIGNSSDIEFPLMPALCAGNYTYEVRRSR